jgi:hypothetical protein
MKLPPHPAFPLHSSTQHNERTNEQTPASSRLKQFVPSVATFFTPLRLCDAFQIYDEKYSIR